MPKAVLRKVFRGKFVAGLRQAFQNGELRFPENFKLLSERKIFAAWLRPLFRQHWVVYLKRPFGGPQYVLQYLGRYTHRVAISNHRLVSFVDGQVTFLWRDSAHNNESPNLNIEGASWGFPFYLGRGIDNGSGEGITRRPTSGST